MNNGTISFQIFSRQYYSLIKFNCCTIRYHNDRITFRYSLSTSYRAISKLQRYALVHQKRCLAYGVLERAEVNDNSRFPRTCHGKIVQEILEVVLLGCDCRGLSLCRRYLLCRFLRHLNCLRHINLCAIRLFLQFHHLHLPLRLCRQ